MQLSGKTRLFAILGAPVAQVKSPQVFNTYFDKTQTDAVLVALDVAADKLKSFWQGIRNAKNLEGLIVTMPHKKAMAGLLDELGPQAQLTGSVNIVKRTAGGQWRGEMFDGEGCVQALRRNGAVLEGKKVFVVGLGGAGESIVMALARAGVAELHLSEIDSLKTASVKSRLSANFPALKIVAPLADAAPLHCDIAINSTPLGMSDEDALPFDLSRIPKDALVFDVITKDTRLIKLARSRAHKAVNGMDMHSCQAVLAAQFLGFSDFGNQP